MFELFARDSEFGGTVMGNFFNGFFQLLNCPQFAELLDEEDETVLQYLENITVDEFEDVKSGYKISFVSLSNLKLQELTHFSLTTTTELPSWNLLHTNLVALGFPLAVALSSNFTVCSSHPSLPLFHSWYTLCHT